MKANKVMAFILVILSMATLAGLPPTTSKISGDSAPVTTFNYEFPNFTGTHNGSTVTLDILGVAGGGTGSSSQNFVDLTTGQTIGGVKTFSDGIIGNITGNASTVTTNANLTGDVTSIGNTTSYNNVVPVAKGGTGSTTQNFVDLTTNQTVAGEKTFSSKARLSQLQASNSAGVDLFNDASSSVAVFGAGGSTGTSLLGTTNIGSASNDYTQVSGGTGSTSLTATGSSTNIDINLTAKGSGSVVAPKLSTNDTTFSVKDSSDPTKQITFDAAGTAGTLTTLQSSQTANRLITLPDLTTTLVGTGGAQTISDKTFVAPVLGNASASSLTITTPLGISSGGTSASTKAGAFDALSPMTTGGDLIYGGASGTGTRLANGASGYILTSNGGTNAPSWQPVPGYTGPTVQTLTTGSGTYTTPANVKYIRVQLVGGGGGGAGSGSSSTGGTGTTGGDTTFGTSLLSGSGGVGGTVSTGGSGGAASLGTGPVGVARTGSQGGYGLFSSNTVSGAAGGESPFGGAGLTSLGSGVGQAAQANSGSGGAGGLGDGTNEYTGSGGGAGGYVEAIINAPSASYSYAVGAGGSGGTAGTSGYAGGAGGSGHIIVWEYY